MERSVERMMSLIRNELTGVPVNADLFKDMIVEDWEKLRKLSKHHDLIHLVGDAVINNELVDEAEIIEKFERGIDMAVYRYQTLQSEFTKLKQYFNEAQIYFMPLKGSVMRELYPEPWMRTSCDIDILVHPSDLERVSELINEKYRCSEMCRSNHDVSFMIRADVHVELHYTLVGEILLGEAEKPLDSIWEYADLTDGSFEYVLRDEMFYYYHLAHMAKHIIATGGCGMRSFIDLWLLNRCDEETARRRSEFLSASGLDRFASEATAICNHWMEEKPLPDSAVLLEQFVIVGGAYGERKNRILVERGHGFGRLRYLLRRIWLPYNQLVHMYPSLKGKRFLQPLFELRRFCRLLRFSVMKRSLKELRTNWLITTETEQQMSEMLSRIGLQ